MRDLLIGSNLPAVKRHNRSLVLRILLHQGPISRTEIGELTRLTPATIGNVVGELIESGLAVELGAAERTSAQRLGRRRLLIDLNAQGFAVVGVYLGVRFIQVGIGDLRGRVLGKSMVSTGEQRSPDLIFSLVREQLASVLRQTGIPRERILGVGVGSIGLVNSATGEVVDMPQYGWRKVPAKVELQRVLGLPTAVDNSRRVMATAEAWLGRGQGIGSVLLVHVATTIGGAVVFRGEVLHGANYAAGQLGHLIVAENGERCTCGRVGCLDTVASGAAMATAMLRASEEEQPALLLAATHGKLDSVDLERVFEAAEHGNQQAQRLIDRSAHYVGVGVAHYVSLFDPEIVILAGGVALLGGRRYLERVAAVATERAYRSGCRRIEIVPTAFGADIELVGPFSLALRHFVYSADAAPLGNGRERRAAGGDRVLV